jgi:hypothetical protein
MSMPGTLERSRPTRLSPAMIYPVLDWFIPTRVRENSELQQRARMFLISHLFGPFLGHTITVYLYLIDPNPNYALWVLATSISLFLGFVRTEVDRLVQHARVLRPEPHLRDPMGCYLWRPSRRSFLVATVPLLAFFYLGSGPSGFWC